MLSTNVPRQHWISDHGPNDITVANPNGQMIAPTTIAAFGRVQFHVSITNATAGSRMLIAEVQAANDSSRKKSVATTTPPGIWPNASGNDWKASPGPAAGSSPCAKAIGKITSADNNAIDVSDKTTATVERGIDSSSLRYAPYVITAPIPTLNEKNAWPSAASTEAPVRSSNRGSNRNTRPSSKRRVVML